MVLLSNFLSAPLALSLLFVRHVVAVPQFITSSDAIYETDVNAITVSTIPISFSVVTDVNGLPLSSVVVSSTPVAAPVVTTDAPVVVTNPLGPAPVTTFSYTSVDVNGDTIVVTATFTPTYQPTVYPTSFRTATVLAYSDFTSLYNIATATAASGAPRAAFEGGAALIWSGAATVAAFVAGARLVAML